MTIDIQVISVVDDLQVLGATELEGAEPRAIQIVGDGGFINAQRVIINEFGIDSFIVVNDRVLIVTPGSSLDNVAVENMDIVVVSSSLTNTRRARLFFGPTKRLSRVTGVQKLIQHIVKILLTNSGTNKFRLSEGGNLFRLLGFVLTEAGKSRIVSSLAQAVSSTEEQLTISQASASGLELDERLLSLTLGDVTFLEDTQEVLATIRLVTFAGRTVSVPLIL
jgi:phage baseplate assembly protein W